MNLESAFSECEAIVRYVDADRYFSALFAPAEKRPLLFALYAFNHELARIGEVVHEPMMGEIRLQWWRETLEGAREGKPRTHDVARAMAELFMRVDLPAELLAAMIEARAFDLTRESAPDQQTLDEYLDATSGNLMRLAARLLGAGDKHDALAREAGIAYGLAGLIRSQPAHRARGKQFIRDSGAAAMEAKRRFVKARALPKPGRALPAFLAAVLVPLYLKTWERDVPLYRKQLAFLSASLRGRI
jgi:phytoene synthase